MEKLKTFLAGIWKFLNSKFFIVGIIMLFIIIMASQCSKILEQRREIKNHEQNIIALNDSLKYERTKNGDFLVTIAGYIATEKELKTLNKGLWDKIQEQNGKVISLNHIVAQLVQDTTILRKYLKQLNSKIDTLVKIDDDTYLASWHLEYYYDKTNYDIYDGITTIRVANKDPLTLLNINSEMLSKKTQIDLTWGQKIENGVLRVFVTSTYPGFNVTQMEGVLIDPNSSAYKNLIKERKWFTGFSIGVGTSIGWNLTTGKYGMVVGPTLSWNIYKW